MIKRLLNLTDREIGELADVLIDCVEGGSSVGFMLPLTRERAGAFWRNVAADVAANRRVLLVAEDDRGICGTVQLIFAQQENQPHRAEVSKMIVHRRARRRGIAEKLMRELETIARECGRTVLVLDTADATAERLYVRVGYVRLGVIPRYALMPQGGYCDTVVFYKELE